MSIFWIDRLSEPQTYNWIDYFRKTHGITITPLPDVKIVTEKRSQDTQQTLVIFSENAIDYAQYIPLEKEIIVPGSNMRNSLYRKHTSISRPDQLIQKVLEFYNKNTSAVDDAFSTGAMLGAMLGDSIGSYLEFVTSVSKQEASTALKMPGGGPFRLKPGQITDDSELALCLAQGLANGNRKLNLDLISLFYAYWMQSKPFDIGMTTSNALEGLAKINVQLSSQNLSIEKVYPCSIRNIDSLSNGGLMRLTPLAIWSRNLSERDLELAISLEQSLTHPNPIAHQAAICYAMAIGYLINNEGNMIGAFNKVDDYVKRKGYPEIQNWWQIVLRSEFITATIQIGFMKIAWTYAFIYLKEQRRDFLNIIEEVISRGGDTDTNACIVGGLIGACVGGAGLPAEQVGILLRVRAEDHPQPRPDFFSPSRVNRLVPTIFELAPTTLDCEPSLHSISKAQMAVGLRSLIENQISSHVTQDVRRDSDYAIPPISHPLPDTLSSRPVENSKRGRLGVVWCLSENSENQSNMQMLSNHAFYVIPQTELSLPRFFGTDQGDYNVVISGSFGRKLVPIIHDHPCVIKILVFCWRPEEQDWTRSFPKVCGVYKEMVDVLERLIALD